MATINNNILAECHGTVNFTYSHVCALKRDKNVCSEYTWPCTVVGGTRGREGGGMTQLDTAGTVDLTLRGGVDTNQRSVFKTD